VGRSLVARGSPGAETAAEGASSTVHYLDCDGPGREGSVGRSLPTRRHPSCCTTKVQGEASPNPRRGRRSDSMSPRGVGQMSEALPVKATRETGDAGVAAGRSANGPQIGGTGRTRRRLHDPERSRCARGADPDRDRGGLDLRPTRGSDSGRVGAGGAAVRAATTPPRGTYRSDAPSAGFRVGGDEEREISLPPELELQRMYGEQDAAFTNTLPLCRGLR
jgi:hypothetical protein